MFLRTKVENGYFVVCKKSVMFADTMNAIFGDSNAVQNTAFDTPLNSVRNSLNISILPPPRGYIHLFAA